MEKPNQREATKEKMFGSVRVRVWINKKDRRLPVVMFQLHALYQNHRGELKVARSIDRGSMKDVQEALRWVESIDPKNY